MQLVLNAKERNLAFLQFLVLFLVTVVLIVAAIYFDFQIGIENSKSIKEQLDRHERAEDEQKEFVALMQETKIMLDSLSKPGTNTQLIDLMLEPKIKELSNLRQMDTSLFGKLDYVVLETFSKLRQDNKEISYLRAQAAQVNRLKEELNSCKNQLTLQPQISNTAEPNIPIQK